MSDLHAPDSEQLALLRDAVRHVDAPVPSPSEGPVAVVWPMMEVPHLDREFEYSVPPELVDDVRVGVAVKVRFKAQQITGYVVALRERAEFAGTLKPLVRVVSPEVVLTEHVWQLAQRVAEYDAGTVSDVLRLAIPPRHARAEKALDAKTGDDQGIPARPSEAAISGDAQTVEAQPVKAETDEDSSDDESAAVAANGAEADRTAERDSGGAWRHYAGGLSFLKHLADGDGPRASWNVAPGLLGDDSWPAALAEAVEATRTSGRGSLIVLPDARDIERVMAACVARLGNDRVVRLSADQGPQARYTAFLKALRGMADVVIGTRAAMFAPVANLGLVAWWDDADTVHVDPHAPYPRVGDVLRMRADLTGAAVLSAGTVPSAAVQARVESREFMPIEPITRTSARVVVTGEDRSVERHGPAARARIPAEAWQGAREALKHGPVLVQVPRRGYIPTIACARCRTKSHCDVCHGPLGLDEPGAPPTCRWCGHVAHVLTCVECGSHEVRSLTIGAGRTAEELGRAFPGVPVRRSGAPDVLATVPDEPAIVVATPGAEPVAAKGYSAAILLDAWALLDRGGLDAGQRALTHWCAAAGLVRPAQDGGVVYLAGVPRHVPFPPVEALVRWAPRWFAQRELAERAEVALPPVARLAALEGPRRAVTAYGEEVSRLAAREGLDAVVMGPLPLGRRHVFDRATSAVEPGAEPDEVKVRLLVRWPDPSSLAVPTLLRSLTASRSAAREAPVTVRLDPLLDGLG